MFQEGSVFGWGLKVMTVIGRETRNMLGREDGKGILGMEPEHAVTWK